MVYRVYVEKKKELANEARNLFNEIRNLLFINNLIPKPNTNAPSKIKNPHTIFQYGEFTSNMNNNNSFHISSSVAIANKSNNK